MGRTLPALTAIMTAVSGFPAFTQTILDDNKSLQVRGEMHSNRFGNVLLFDLKNQTEEPLCVGTMAFQPTNDAIDFFDKRNTRVGRRTVGDPAVTLYRNMNYSDDYLILPPKKVGYAQMNLQNVIVSKGQYQYRGFIQYFRCAELVSEKFKNGVQLRARTVTGQINLK